MDLQEIGIDPVVLLFTLAISSMPAADRWLLVAAWLCGAALVALFGLYGYAAGNEWVSQAEGVRRVQAFYDANGPDTTITGAPPALSTSE